MAKALVVFGCLAAVAGLDLVRRRKRRRQKNVVSKETWRASPNARIMGARLPMCSERKAPRKHGGAVTMCILFVATLMVWLGGWLLSEGDISGNSSFHPPLVALYFSFFLTLLISAFFAVHSLRNPRSFASATAIESDSSQTHTIPDFSGLWIKNDERSTSTDDVMEIMHIGRFLRTAVRLVRGLDIHQDATSFQISVISIFRCVKITEKYALDGEKSEWRRRDLRKGRHTGYVEWNEDSQTLSLVLEWSSPFAGKGTDQFHRLSPTELFVRSVLETPDGKTASYDTFYRKK